MLIKKICTKTLKFYILREVYFTIHSGKIISFLTYFPNLLTINEKTIHYIQ